MIIDILFLFLLFFSFPIPLVGNSLLLVLILSIFRITITQKWNICILNLKNKYFVYIVLGAFFMAIYSLLISTISNQLQLEKFYVYISQIIGFSISVIVFSSFKSKISKIGYYLVYVFVIQSVIQIISFGSLGFHSVVQMFQFDAEKEIAEVYGGIRGNAISGRLFFELAASYGLVLIICAYNILDSKKVKIESVVTFILLFIGSFFVGRTSLIGALFALLLMVLIKKKQMLFFHFVFKTILISICIGWLFFIFLPEDIQFEVTNRLLPWVFELFYTYKDTGTAHSDSLSHLSEDMYNIDITLQEWMIGSGNYTNLDGTYYKYTDSGYLRQILFFGILGSFLNFIYTISFFYNPYISNKKNGNKLMINFLIIVLLYMLILQYKGEILGHSRFYLTILFVFLFSKLNNSKYDRCCNSLG